MIKKEKIELIKLIASDGMTLTDGKGFGKEVYLGCIDKEENWYEISDEEAEELQEKKLKELYVEEIEDAQ